MELLVIFPFIGSTANDRDVSNGKKKFNGRKKSKPDFDYVTLRSEREEDHQRR